MAENVYEGMYILDSNHYAKDADAASSGVNDLIEKNGGEILASRLWVEQRLAYPIDNHRKGTYWLTYFRMDSQRLVDVNRGARLNDTILRSLVIKIDPRLVDAMVDHALGKTPEEAPAEEGNTEGETGKPKPEVAEAK